MSQNGDEVKTRFVINGFTAEDAQRVVNKFQKHHKKLTLPCQSVQQALGAAGMEKRAIPEGPRAIIQLGTRRVTTRGSLNPKGYCRPPPQGARQYGFCYYLRRRQGGRRNIARWSRESSRRYTLRESTPIVPRLSRPSSLVQSDGIIQASFIGQRTLIRAGENATNPKTGPTGFQLTNRNPVGSWVLFEGEVGNRRNCPPGLLRDHWGQTKNYPNCLGTVDVSGHALRRSGLKVSVPSNPTGVANWVGQNDVRDAGEGFSITIRIFYPKGIKGGNFEELTYGPRARAAKQTIRLFCDGFGQIYIIERKPGTNTPKQRETHVTDQHVEPMNKRFRKVPAKISRVPGQVPLDKARTVLVESDDSSVETPEIKRTRSKLHAKAIHAIRVFDRIERQA